MHYWRLRHKGSVGSPESTVAQWAETCRAPLCKRETWQSGYCIAHNERMRHGLDMGPIRGERLRLSENERIEARLFLERVINKETGCWEWIGDTVDTYGRLRIEGRTYRVHRLSAFLYKGMRLDDCRCVCHTCDNPKCFNPAHLFLGSIDENNMDKVAKKRQARGESNGSSKLTEEDVRDIRAKRAAGTPRWFLAQEYGICKNSVYNIVQRNSWKHV